MCTFLFSVYVDFSVNRWAKKLQLYDAHYSKGKGRVAPPKRKRIFQNRAMGGLGTGGPVQESLTHLGTTNLLRLPPVNLTIMYILGKD